MSKEPSIGKLLLRVLQGLVCIILSFLGIVLAVLGACNGHWDMATFGLVLMYVADHRFDKIYADTMKEGKQLEEDLTGP